MTTNEQQMNLPKIPSLPPIEMPDAASFLDTPDFTDDCGKVSPMNPSSASLVSQDTFMTADSSLFSDLNATPTTNSPELGSPASPVSLVPPTSLRKSISVDSFIKYRNHTDPATRPIRGNTVSSITKPYAGNAFQASQPTSEPPAQSTSSASTGIWRDWDKWPSQQRAGPSRSRGTSISATRDELNASFLDESDMEQSEDHISITRKGKSTLRRILAPGDLPLPSRLQTHSSSPTMGKPPPPIVPERSSSLSHKLTKQRSLISVNTHLPPPSYQPSDITIAVIGATNSGKSTIIRKGLKAYGLSDGSSSTSTPGASGEIFRYIYRVGRISHNQATDCLLRVLEVDIPRADLTAGDSRASRSIFPDEAPSVDGLVICYDASEESSFKLVERTIGSVSSSKIPTIVFACKSDIERKVDPNYASSVLEQYDVGLIEATTMNTQGKLKIRTAFEWLFKAIFTQKLNGGVRESYRNPASPAVLSSPGVWEISRASSVTPTASSSIITTNSPLVPQNRISTPALPPSPDDPSRTPRTPLSPTRTRSMSDLLTERERDWDPDTPSSNTALGASSSRSRRSSNTALSGNGEGMSSSFDDGNEHARSITSRESRPPRWMTLDELLDKLLFVSVSEDDPTFISHFLLTYRRFALPRALLLAMQKRMRALDQSTVDPMFACYAQMKICWLLDHWMHLYPSDFAVPGTTGALSALIKSIIGKTYLLHYGSVFIPFTESLPTLKDQDSTWAMRVDDPKDDSDDSYSVTDAPIPASPVSSHSITLPEVAPPPTFAIPVTVFARERKSSLPLSAKLLMLSNSPTQIAHANNSVELTWPKKLRALAVFSQQFMTTDLTSIAQEISRVECQFFLRIEPRHWLQHVIGRGKKDPESDTISQYNFISNHIANWVVSLILCHDKPKVRARVIHLFVGLASRLRNMNNYSALRAVVAGINSAAFESDASMQTFKAKNPQQFKLFQSFDYLLQAVRAHGKYRMALRNSKGACIPALEIHLSDLIRAHEGNTDFHDDDPNHIHWEKFNMMGRFIDGIIQCQQACRETKAFQSFPEDQKALDLLLFSKDNHLMEPEEVEERVQMDKLDSVRDDETGEDAPRPPFHRYQPRESPLHGKDGPLRKIFFW